MRFTCPVCFYANLPYPPSDYHICPSCGTEFGNDDAGVTHAQLRQRWINGGARWFFGDPPVFWNAWTQLITGNRGLDIPWMSGLIIVDSSNTPVQVTGERRRSYEPPPAYTIQVGSEA